MLGSKVTVLGGRFLAGDVGLRERPRRGDASDGGVAMVAENISRAIGGDIRVRIRALREIQGRFRC